MIYVRLKFSGGVAVRLLGIEGGVLLETVTRNVTRSRSAE
jgi:hypothetical protein